MTAHKLRNINFDIVDAVRATLFEGRRRRRAIQLDLARTQSALVAEFR